MNLEFHPSTIYHLHNHNHTVASSNANKRSTSDGTRLVHGNQTGSVQSAAGVNRGAPRLRHEREAGRLQGKVAAAATYVSFVVVAEKGACRLVPTTTRAEGFSPTQRVCMLVVLCRLWVLNVWLLCTHTYTHTHTSACILTAAAATTAATACTVGCACVREHTRAFPRTSC